MSYERMIALRYLDPRRLAWTTGVILVSLITLTMTILHALTLYSKDGALSRWEWGIFLIPLVVIGVGWKLLSRKGVRGNVAIITSISVSGVTIGVMALLTVISVMNGFGEDIRTRILGTDSHLKFWVGQRPDWKEVLSFLSKQDGVVAGCPRIDEFVLAEPVYGGAQKPIRIRGIDPELEIRTTNLREYIDKGGAGSIFALSPPKVLGSTGSERVRITDLTARAKPIFLGSEVAASFFGKSDNPEVYVGERIYVYPPNVTQGINGPMPKREVFEVEGIFKSGMYDYDSSLAYISISTAMGLLGRGNVDSIDLRLENPDAHAAERKGRELAALLTEETGQMSYFDTWMTLNEPFFRALQMEKSLIFIIQVLVVLVAAFNIASTLIMMVMSKTRDIGILMAIGAENGGIKWIFTLMGAGVGIAGTCVGCILAFGMCLYLKQVEVVLPRAVYYVPTLPVVMHWSDFAIVAVCSCAICFIAALFPARNAARLQPVEALRYE